MEGYEKEGFEGNDRDEIFSKAVRAGKRTYFFDVKSTKRGDLYLTLTESKKRFNKDGRHYFEKHKLFLYKEDFDKFSDGLTEVVDYIKSAKIELTELPNEEFKTFEAPITEELVAEASIVEEPVVADFTTVEFEDLDKM